MSTFAEIGFLSCESADFRTSMRERHAVQFEMVDGMSALAIAELQAVSGDLRPAHLVALAFWLRCIESVQATVLLAERGMPTSAQSVLRTGLECLFAACALWRKPEVMDKMEAWHHIERVKQAKAVLSVGAEGRVTPESLAELKDIAAERPPMSNWSHWEAACAADLRFEYAMMYRGLGIGGAHASPRSLDDFHSVQQDGSFDLHLSPCSERLEWLLGLVVTCFTIGITRQREACRP